MKLNMGRMIGLVGLALALLAGMARAGERRVDVAPGLNGAWLVPDAGWHGQVVILLHGFASDMDDAGDLYKRLAEALAAKGIASLRINFRGEGDRYRTKIESTFTMRLEDAGSAREFVVRQPGVAADRVGVAGWSLGASTAIVSGGRHPAWFRTMALWSSPSGNEYEAMCTGEMAATMAEAERAGVGTLVIPGWKTITVTRAFFESFRGIDLDAELAKYPGAFFTLRGSEDSQPQHDVAFLKVARGRPAEALQIGGADHIFSVFDPKSTNAARAVELTVAWFERTL